MPGIPVSGAFTKEDYPSCYKTIPEPLPKEVTLQEILTTMPREVFQKNMWKAWWNVAVSIAFTALSIYLISISPWYLLPLAWAFAGTACTGLFVIGHDCGHKSFAKSGWLNDLVGITMFLPLIYPFEPWRIQHNHHHNHTNKLDVDNAWQPFRAESFYYHPTFLKVILSAVKGPFWWIASTGHWLKNHFALSLFTETQRPKVVISLVALGVFSVFFFPLMIYYFGVWGLVKYWGIPWLGFHFWLSTFTMVHHTLPFLPFMELKDWTDARARLASTVHCDYPSWIEFLCHQINVHIPHHVSTAIPSYNLWKAHYALKARWGKYMHECEFGWFLLRDITTKCHLYDSEEAYKPFDEGLAKFEQNLKKRS